MTGLLNDVKRYVETGSHIILLKHMVGTYYSEYITTGLLLYKNHVWLGRGKATTPVVVWATKLNLIVGRDMSLNQ